MIETPSLTIAFAAGFVSFVSPCCLPLVPGYLAAVSEPGGGHRRRSLRALTFTLTFSLIFIALGLTATALGAFLFEHQPTLNRIGGGLIIALGLFSIAAVSVLPLNRSWRARPLIDRAAGGSPVAAGAAFAVAWTPCVGPTLGATLSLAATSAGTPQATLLLASYSAGLAVPFLLVAAGAVRLAGRLSWFRRHAVGLQVIAGLTMIAMGVLVFSGELFRLNIEAQQALDHLDLNFWQNL